MEKKLVVCPNCQTDNVVTQEKKSCEFCGKDLINVPAVDPLCAEAEADAQNFEFHNDKGE